MAIASLGLVGQATALGTDTLVIPLTTTIPRSDPSTGATVIFVTVISDDASASSSPNAMSDDGVTDPFYGTCLFTDGLNHYASAPVGADYSVANLVINQSWVGLVCNPLDASNSITVVMNAPQGYLLGIAVAYTGVNLPYIGTGGFSDLPSLISASPSDPWVANNAFWTFHLDGSVDVYLSAPTGYSGPPDWTWVLGSYAIYNVAWNDISNPTSGAWVWDQAGITTEFEIDDESDGVGAHNWSFVWADQPLAPPEVVALTGSASPGWWFPQSSGAAWALAGGPGPSCNSTPPPGGGNPVFNNHIRLSE